MKNHQQHLDPETQKSIFYLIMLSITGIVVAGGYWLTATRPIYRLLAFATCPSDKAVSQAAWASSAGEMAGMTVLVIVCLMLGCIAFIIRPRKLSFI